MGKLWLATDAPPPLVMALRCAQIVMAYVWRSEQPRGDVPYSVDGA